MKILEGLYQFKMVYDSREEPNIVYVNLKNAKMYTKGHTLLNDGNIVESIEVKFDTGGYITIICNHDEFDNIFASMDYFTLENYLVDCIRWETEIKMFKKSMNYISCYFESMMVSISNEMVDLDVIDGNKAIDIYKFKEE